MPFSLLYSATSVSKPQKAIWKFCLPTSFPQNDTFGWSPFRRDLRPILSCGAISLEKYHSLQVYPKFVFSLCLSHSVFFYFSVMRYSPAPVCPAYLKWIPCSLSLDSTPPSALSVQTRSNEGNTTASLNFPPCDNVLLLLPQNSYMTSSHMVSERFQN